MSENINLRLHSEHARALRKLAAMRGVTLSEVIRDLLLREIGKVFASEHREKGEIS